MKRTARSIRRPAPMRDRGWPEETSATTPQRSSRAATRRPRARSGVTRAQVRPGVSSVSRIIRARAAAASSSARTVTTDRPSSPSAIGSADRSRKASARRAPMTVRQSSVASAGRRASLISRWRARPRDAAPGSSGGWNHGRTASRSARPSSSRQRAFWGCCSLSPRVAQTAGSSSRSSPGRTTQPRGAAATAASTSAAAGAVPVEPAAMTVWVGGRSVQASARRRSSRARRQAGSTIPMASSRFGQASTARARNSADSRQCSARSPSTRVATRFRSVISSSWQESRKPPRASAISSARRGDRPGRKSSTIIRAISKRRVRGAMAGGRSRPSSPGAKGGSSSSRSPRGRTWGNRIGRPPACLLRAAVKARAARRLGSRMTASDRTSGGRSPSQSSIPAARSSRKGRRASMAYQRGTFFSPWSPARWVTA